MINWFNNWNPTGSIGIPSLATCVQFFATRVSSGGRTPPKPDTRFRSLHCYFKLNNTQYNYMTIICGCTYWYSFRIPIDFYICTIVSWVFGEKVNEEQAARVGVCGSRTLHRVHIWSFYTYCKLNKVYFRSTPTLIVLNFPKLSIICILKLF